MLPQIYLPVGWSTYFFSAARVEPFQPEEVARARAEVRPAARQCLQCRRSTAYISGSPVPVCGEMPVAFALHLAAGAAGLYDRIWHCSCVFTFHSVAADFTSRVTLCMVS